MKYLERFDGMVKKTAGTPTGLGNDYSGVLYLVNCQGRRAQAELCLAREVAQPASGKGTILPPDTQVYKTGFFYLAGELLYGNYPRENLALYTEEGLDFLLYEILWGLSDLGAYGDAADYPEEKHKIRNLASDFKKFIALVNEEEKTALLAGAREKAEFSAAPYDRLFAALKLYEEKVAGFANDRKGACFFSPLEAYKELLRALSSGGALKTTPAEFNRTRVIAVEDAGDMEPLFRTLARKLKEAGYNVEEVSSADFRPSARKALDLKGFITTLDEAEYVGWRIKKLLAEGEVKEGEISVACFSRETAQLLPLVFTRYGLQAASAAPASSSRLFQTYAAAVRLALNLAPRAEDYLELLGSPASALCLEKSRLNAEVPGSGRKTIRQFILEAGYKAGVNRGRPDPRYWIEAALKRPEVTGLLQEGEKKKLETLIGLSGQPRENIFSDLVGISVDQAGCADYGLLKTMGRLAMRADAALAACGGNESGTALLASSLLNLMAGTEYYPRGEESRDSYMVPVLPPERMLNTSASHVFACGLTGEADKLKKLPIPEKLAAALGLTGSGASGRAFTYPEQLREKVYLKFEKLAGLGENGGLDVTLTYGYNNLGGDMAGVSNLVRAVKKYYAKNDNKGGEIPSLYAAHELMLAGGGKAPDGSYSFTAAPDAGPAPSAGADLPAKAGRLDLLTLLRLRELKYREKKPPPLGGDGLPLKVEIGVRDFAAFINCPRKFITKIFLQAAGIQEEKDHDSQIPLTKGNFWHSVFERAGASPEFYSGDKSRILAALCSAFEDLLKDPKKDPETFQDLPLEEFKAESRRVFGVFAEKEARRQITVPGLKGLARELECELDIGAIPLGAGASAEKVKLVIKGRIDRLDISGTGPGATLHLWDYKSGRSKPELSWGKARFSQKSETALQLAIYCLMLAEAPGKYSLPGEFGLGRISGANIFLDGTDNMKDPEENSGNLGGMARRVKEEALRVFTDFFAQKTLAAMDEDYAPAALKAAGKPEQIYNPHCSYCNTHLCRFTSLGGLEEGRHA